MPEIILKNEILHAEKGEKLSDILIKNGIFVDHPCAGKGICKKCGKNLNEEKCECDDFVPDVRLANLMDIFNAAQK